ncbi:MAG TPA: hypothetical protein VGQ08_08830 [Nitrospiraceae bacterium]|nr:hypothetical protein [Nitrospiraceae bacterium]
MNSFRITNNRTRVWLIWPLLAIVGLTLLASCVSQPPTPQNTIYESGLNTVRLEEDPDSTSNTYPTALTPTEVGTLLRGVRSWERRNVIHQLFSGQADRTRAFRDEEIILLAPALSKALAQATPTQRVSFHLSHATDQGEEETTNGWLSVRGTTFYLSLSEVHDRHSPGPDISKYDRQMPNVPERSAAFDVTFEPEEYLAKVSSSGRLFAPDQREELQILYREALLAMPIQPGLDQGRKIKPSQP